MSKASDDFIAHMDEHHPGWNAPPRVGGHLERLKLADKQKRLSAWQLTLDDDAPLTEESARAMVELLNLESLQRADDAARLADADDE